MSEEQPTFKVRDRRLFNPDGTPRDIEREEAPEAATTTATETSAAAKTAGAGEGPATANAESPTASGAATGRSEGVSSAATAPASGSGEDAARGASSAARAQADEDDFGREEEVPGADDPASFINFLMSIASNAAAALGMMEHPVTGQRGVDLPLAKHWIDVLGMLQQKTLGNLAPQEQQIFEGLLSDLRLQYVSLTTPPSGPRRGFTGRDIIGGK